MMPLVSNTQIIIPTQATLPAVVSAPPLAASLTQQAITPAVPDPRLGPDYKGNGGYVSVAGSAPAAQASSAPLSFLIPAFMSTSSASLSVGSMLATQIASQEGGDGYLQVYEEMVAASQVKYKPSDATMPKPAPNDLFSKMLAEEKTHVSQMITQQPKAAVEQVASTVQQPAAKPAARRESSAPNLENVRARATSAYSSTVSRNRSELENDAQVEPLLG